MKKVLIKTPRFNVIERPSNDRNFQFDDSIDKNNAVSIVPIYNDNVLMLCIKRPQRTRSLEFPGGGIETGEDVGTAARRELSEELGVNACALDSLGVVAPLPGFVSERVHLFSTELSHQMIGNAAAAKQYEGISGLRVVRIRQLPDLCASGTIDSAVDAYLAMRIAWSRS